MPSTVDQYSPRMPNCNGANLLEKLDAQAYSHRSSQRGRFAKAPPQSDAAPTESMRSKTSRRMKVCGEPVSRSATQP